MSFFVDARLCPYIMLSPVLAKHRTPILKPILSTEEIEQVKFLSDMYPKLVHLCEANKDTFTLQVNNIFISFYFIFLILLTFLLF